MSRRLLQMIFYGDPSGYPPIINCARCLVLNGWRVEMVCREKRTHPEVNFSKDVSVIRIESQSTSPWMEYLGFAWKATCIVTNEAVAVVGHDMHGLLPAALASKRHAIPLVYHCHDYAERGRELPAGSRIIKSFERLLVPRAALTIIPDRKRAAIIAHELRLPGMPIILPNAPRSSSVPREGTLRRQLKGMGISFDKIVIRQGRIGPNHGIEATIRSMPMWSNKNWGFVLIGPSEDSYLHSLRSLSKQLGVAPQCVILPATSYDTILNYTVDGDLGHALYDPVNINHVESGTASNKTLEYMAARLPCLVSKSNSTADLISLFNCGIAVDPSNPEEIAAAINAMFENEQMRYEMASAGAQAFESQFRYEVRFRDFAAALDTLIQTF